MHLLYLKLLITSIFIVYPFSTYADEDKIYGMNRIIVHDKDGNKSIKGASKLNKIEADNDKIITIDDKETLKEDIRDIAKIDEEKIDYEIKSLAKDKKYILESSKLQIWPYISDLYNKKSKNSRENAMRIISSDLSTVPPIFLYEASKILAQQGDLENAAEYFLIAELRYEFDKKRFSPKRSSKRDPRKLFPFISAHTGRYIRPYLAKNSKRFELILDKVSLIDKNTPYHYHPNYPFTDKLDYEKMEDAATENRDAFILKYKKYTRALNLK